MRRSDTDCSADWKAGLLAGLSAGLVYLPVEMALVSLVDGASPWLPTYLMAAILLGGDVVPQPGAPAPFEPRIFLFAMMVHIPLSLAYGVKGAWLIYRCGLPLNIVIGTATGIAIYLVNFHLIAPLLFPWFVAARGWVTLSGHLLFGGVLALAYILMTRRSMRLQEE